VKRSDLKELIREEIKKVLSENTEDVKDKSPIKPGKYKIEYRTLGNDGEPTDDEESGIVNISQKDIEMDQNTNPSRFWEGEASNISSFKIYKVLKVTKVG
jgi:hypothetical protein